MVCIAGYCLNVDVSFNRGTWLRCKGHEKMIEQKSGDCTTIRDLVNVNFTAKRGGTTRICGTIRIMLNMVL